ncbi:MAG: hypothetical protein HYS32_04335 [Candidatus Woesearchaeota archaeon]|nr:MAG: hypothetical protein HYS32_04335 [Candidatus Woesearchaeota archaeon]
MAEARPLMYEAMNRPEKHRLVNPLRLLITGTLVAALAYVLIKPPIEDNYNLARLHKAPSTSVLAKGGDGIDSLLFEVNGPDIVNRFNREDLRLVFRERNSLRDMPKGGLIEGQEYQVPDLRERK